MGLPTARRADNVDAADHRHSTSSMPAQCWQISSASQVRSSQLGSSLAALTPNRCTQLTSLDSTITGLPAKLHEFWPAAGATDIRDNEPFSPA